MSEEYAIVIITPDAVQDKLEEAIIRDLIKEDQNQIIWRKYWKIEKEIVKTIYPRMINKPFYSSIVRNMTLGTSLFLLVKGKDIYNRLREIKGEFRKFNGKIKTSGLRFKYRTQSIKKEVVVDYKDKKLLDRIFKFRLHTTDNLKETAIICLLCMNPSEIEKLKNIAPTLYSKIKYIDIQDF